MSDAQPQPRDEVGEAWGLLAGSKGDGGELEGEWGYATHQTVAAALHQALAGIHALVFLLDPRGTPSLRSHFTPAPLWPRRRDVA